MNSLVSYVSNDVNHIDYNIISIITGIMILFSFICVIHFVSNKFDTIKKSTEVDSALMIKQIKELNKRYDSLSFNRFKRKLTQLEYDITSLKTFIYNNNTKLNKDMLLLKQDTNLYTNFACVRFSGELTDKINKLKIKIDDVITQNKMQRLEDRIIKLEEVPIGRVDAKVEILHSKLKYISETTQSHNEGHETQIAYLKQNFREMMYNMETFRERLHVLITEFDESNNLVVIGDYGLKPVIVKTNINNLIQSIRQDYHMMSFDLHSLKYLHALKTLDLNMLYNSVSMIYVRDQSNELDKVDFHRNWTSYSTIKDIRDIPLLFQIEGSKKVIEYIRSIRPDIELAWNGTPL